MPPRNRIRLARGLRWCYKPRSSPFPIARRPSLRAPAHRAACTSLSPSGTNLEPLAHWQRCSMICQGSSLMACDTCGGKGYVRIVEDCGRCRGRGEDMQCLRCIECRGSGRTDQRTTGVSVLFGRAHQALQEPSVLPPRLTHYGLHFTVAGIAFVSLPLSQRAAAPTRTDDRAGTARNKRITLRITHACALPPDGSGHRRDRRKSIGGHGLRWCRGGDSNPHSLTGTRS